MGNTKIDDIKMMDDIDTEDMKQDIDDTKYSEDLLIFDDDKYDYNDNGRVISIEDCFAAKRICHIICKYWEWVTDVSQLQRLLNYKNKQYKDEKLLIDITKYLPSIDDIINKLNYNNIKLLNDFNYLKVYYFDNKVNPNFHYIYKQL